MGNRGMAKNKHKMAAAAILNLSESATLGPSNPRMAIICLQTKFGANWSSSGWNTPVCVFPRWRPSATL